MAAVFGMDQYNVIRYVKRGGYHSAQFSADFESCQLPSCVRLLISFKNHAVSHPLYATQRFPRGG